MRGPAKRPVWSNTKSKSENFIEQVDFSIEKIVGELENLSKLNDPLKYESTEQERKAILDKLIAEATDAVEKLKARPQVSKVKWSVKDAVKKTK